MSTECENDFFSVEIDNVDKEKVYIDCFGECKPNRTRYRKNSPLQIIFQKVVFEFMFSYFYWLFRYK